MMNNTTYLKRIKSKHFSLLIILIFTVNFSFAGKGGSCTPPTKPTLSSTVGNLCHNNSQVYTITNPQGGATNTWNFSGTGNLSAATGNSTTLSNVTSSGKLTAVATDGCSSYTSVYIHSFNTPTPNAGADVSTCEGVGVQIGDAAAPTSITNVAFREDFSNPDFPGMTRTNDGHAERKWRHNLESGNTAFTGASADSYFHVNNTSGGGSTWTVQSFQLGSIDLSSYTAVNFSMNHWYRHDNANRWAMLEYSTNNGTSWTTVNTWTATTGSAATPNAYSVSVPGAAGQANVIFRFSYRSNSSTTYGWYIGDILINGSVPVNYSWSPATGLSDPTIPNPIASPSSNTNYILTATAGNCSRTDNVTVSVNQAPSDGTISANLSTICAGQSVTVTPSGGTGTPHYWISDDGGLNWNIAAGVAPNGPGNSYVFTPPASGGTFLIHARWQTSCGFCWELPGGVANCTTFPAVTVSSNPIGNTLSTNGESCSCTLSGTDWIRFYSSTGNLILAINPNGENLGEVEVTSFVGGGGTMFACDNPGNTFYETAYMGRSWIITSENPPTNPVSVQYPFSNGELNALETLSLTTVDNLIDDVDDRDDLVLTKFTADNPADENSDPSDNCSVSGTTRVLTQVANGSNPYGLTNTQYVIFNLSEFSENFLHGSSGPSALPVELTSFSASCINDFVHLNWTTGSELNSHKFIVESSRDLSSWNVIGEVQSVGNSSQISNYQFVDEYSSGLTYYRLRQVDFDGKEEVFNSIFANCNTSNNSIAVYPNPTKGEFTITLNSDEQFNKASLIITDISGKTIVDEPIQIVVGQTEIYKDLAKYKVGTYFIHVKTDKNTFKPVKIVKAQ